VAVHRRIVVRTPELQASNTPSRQAADANWSTFFMPSAKGSRAGVITLETQARRSSAVTRPSSGEKFGDITELHDWHEPWRINWS
jgi:hypothetical protein